MVFPDANLGSCTLQSLVAGSVCGAPTTHPASHHTHGSTVQVLLIMSLLKDLRKGEELRNKVKLQKK